MINHVADEKMIRDAMGDDETEKMAIPPFTVAELHHPLWPKIETALREVYDPEIPVNIYELGLIYKVDIDYDTNNVFVEMTLTAPGCPVAGEMPGMIHDAIATVEGIGEITVELVWEPAWDPSKMAETAKLQLNMF